VEIKIKIMRQRDQCLKLRKERPKKKGEKDTDDNTTEKVSKIT